MVAPTSVTANNGPTHDNEKRRKLTVERAKANHLSRQLQMRLQYARLKVDHGWQKQNLYEVENLYFHHSHQRGPKAYPSPSMVATTQPSSSHSSTANPPQWSLHSKPGQSSLSRSHTGVSFSTESPPLDDSLPTTIPQPTLACGYVSPNQSAPGPSINPAEMKDLIPMEVDQERKHSATPPTIPRHTPSPALETSQLPDHSNTTFESSGGIHRRYSVQTSNSPAITWSNFSQSPPSTSNHYPNVAPRQPQTQPLSQSSTVSGDNSFSYPGVSLTYDSFWSSHSSSAGSRSFRTSPGSTVMGGPDSGGMADAALSKTYQVSTSSVRGGGRKIAARATAGREG